MANDLDRKYHAEISNAHPVAYALKGSSMTNDCFMKMLRFVIEKCEENGLAVLATASDGQWHKYGVRNWDGKPLSVLQLQRDLWNDMKSQSKVSILSEIRKRYSVKSISDVKLERKDTGEIIVYGHVHDTPLYVYQGPDRRFDTVSETATNEQETPENQSELSNSISCALDTCEVETPADIAAAVRHSEEVNQDINIGISEHVMFRTESQLALTLNRNEAAEPEYNFPEPFPYIAGDSEVHEGFLTFLEEAHNVENTIQQLGVVENSTIQSDDSFNCRIPSVIEAAHSVLYNTETFEFAETQIDIETEILRERYSFEETNNNYGCMAVTESAMSISQARPSAITVEMGNLQENYFRTENRNCISSIGIWADSCEQGGLDMKKDNVSSNTKSSTDLNPQNNTAVRQGSSNRYVNLPLGTVMLKLQLGSRKKKWIAKSEECLINIFSDINIACKELTKEELLLCWESFNCNQTATSNVSKSWPKTKIAELIVQSFFASKQPMEFTINLKRKRKLTSPQKLQVLVMNRVSKLSKDVIGAILCENKWLTCW